VSVRGSAPEHRRERFRNPHFAIVSTIIFEALHPDVRPPQRATEHSAGYDLSAYLHARTVRVFVDGKTIQRSTEQRDGKHVLVLQAGERALVPLGFRTRLPIGIEAQVRPRSGTSLKTDIIIANAPGTIDADYPEEWCVPVRHGGTGELVITHGERIAQMVLAKHEVLDFTLGEVHPTTSRAGGFGSTGR
jgi:dUTP pyrophosphatase